MSVDCIPDPFAIPEDTGQLLGPAQANGGHGAGPGTGSLASDPIPEDDLSPNERSQFRKMADHPDIIDAVIDESDAIAEHLAMLFGEPDDPTTEAGYVFLGLGIDPTLADTGAVQYARWNERAFSWPREAAQAVKYAAQADADVFLTPCRSTNPLRAGARRKPMATAWLWVDRDHPTALSDAYAAELVAGGARRVDSGSEPGRFHLYVPLSEPVPAAEAEVLNRRLAVRLGGDPAVGRHTGYLRLAGTVNRKPVARGGAPVPVVLHTGNGGVFSAADLAEDLPDAPPLASTDVEMAEPEDVDLESLGSSVVGLADLVAEQVTDGMDRSAATMRLVGAAHDAGLTAGQALELATRHAPSVDKYGPRLGREVARCWAKVAATAADGAENDSPRKRGPESVATQLVRLAVAGYRFAQDETGRAFAVKLDGPAIAVPLEGGRGALRDELARCYFEEHGKAAAKSALADAVTTLAGMAASAPTEPLALRSAVLGDDRVVVDLGRPDGHAVMVTADGWELVERSPVTFRRTELTGPLPDPVHGEGVGALRRLVNVTDEVAALVFGYLVATFLTDMPRPILAAFAEQGAGKTSMVRTLVAAVDPSPVPLRAAPSNLEGWVVAAAGSSVVALDNLSTIPEWLSDALCRAATGEGLVRRKLYSDDALAVTTMRRSVILTTIDAGALRGDLAERLVAIELERIDPTQRMTDADLAAALDRDHPAILAAILDALAGVLAHRPKLPPDVELPRMADFGRVLAALDAWAGTDALGTYRDGLDRVAFDVVEGDPLANALRTVALTGGFDGTAAELLNHIAALRPPTPKGTKAPWWPTSPRMLAGAVRRSSPALRVVGVAVDTRRTGSARRITLSPASDGSDHYDGPPSVEGRGLEREESTGNEKPRHPRVEPPSQPSQPSLTDDLCDDCGHGPGDSDDRDYCETCGAGDPFS